MKMFTIYDRQTDTYQTLDADVIVILLAQPGAFCTRELMYVVFI